MRWFRLAPWLLAVLVASAPPMAAEEPRGDGAKPPGERVSPDRLFDRDQEHLPNISAYEPMYFLVGANPEDSAFQLSFKYRFYNPPAGASGRQEWLSGLHFGYTQTSFWDLGSDSKPFEDTSYKPDLFHRTPDVGSRLPWVDGLVLQTGVQHESNGRGGYDKRFTNHLYLRPVFVFTWPGSRLALSVAPKVWVYFDTSDTNPDLADYRGHFELEVKVGRAESVVLGSRARWAREGGSLQLDLTYPLHQHLLPNTHLFVHAQYVNALAENLIDYRQRTEALRLGLAFVR